MLSRLAQCDRVEKPSSNEVTPMTIGLWGHKECSIDSISPIHKLYQGQCLSLALRRVSGILKMISKCGLNECQIILRDNISLARGDETWIFLKYRWDWNHDGLLCWIWINFPCTKCFCHNFHACTYRMRCPLSWPSAPLLLTKEFTSQQTKCSNGPVLLVFTGLVIFLISLKQLAWWNSRMSRRQYVAGREQCSWWSCIWICSKPTPNMWCCFSHCQDSQVQE